MFIDISKKNIRLWRFIVCMLCFTNPFVFGEPLPDPAMLPSGGDQSHFNLIPWPKSIQLKEGSLTLGNQSRIKYADASLQKCAALLSDEIHQVHWLKIEVSAGTPSQNDIGLKIDRSLRKEQYRLEVTSKITITGGSYQGVSNGTVTLLQALKNKNGNVMIPRLLIEDEPDVEFRSVLIDVARKWHPLPVLRDLIVMCRLYKINYMQLHLTDNESFTFPSKAFPDLPTVQHGSRRHYTWEELLDLVEFADARGVTLIPELETPGHSQKLRKVEPFGRPGLSAVNLASEDVYDAFEILIHEMCQVFKSSPYFHIGTDEVSLKGQGLTVEDKAYMKKYGLEGNKDLFYHHIRRLHEIVKRNNKKTIRWGGFGSDGSTTDKIPKEIIHMAWQLRGSGTAQSFDRTIINAAWKPLYVVNQKSWLPEYLIDSWHIRLWQFHMENSNGRKVADHVPVFGAQMCAWENPSENELPALRWRLPAMCEKIYFQKSGRKYIDFKKRFDQLDEMLDQLYSPVKIDIDGLVGPKTDRVFNQKITIQLKGIPGHDIRYTLDGSEPDLNSHRYSEPIQVNAANVKAEKYLYSKPHGRHLRFGPRLHVNVANFNSSGKIVGQSRDNIYYAILPKVRTKIYYSPKMFDNSKADWLEARDWESLGIAPDKEELWPDLSFGMPSSFRGVGFLPIGSGLISKGKIKISSPGKYVFMYAEKGGEIYINGQRVTRSNTGQLDPIQLNQGQHHIELRAAYPSPFVWLTQNVLYTRLDGRSLDSLIDPPKRNDTYSRPKNGLWFSHEELLLPLDGHVIDNGDEEAPSTPENLAGSVTGAHSLKISWNKSTDNQEVDSYIIYGNSKILARTSFNSITLKDLESNTWYHLSVSAMDRAGNASAHSESIQLKTDAETTPPPPTEPSPQPPVSSEQHVYEAEHAAVQGVKVIRNIVDYINATDDRITWSIEINKTGNHRLDFKYALSSGERPLEIKVDDKVIKSELPFTATGTWKTFNTQSITVFLNKGTHSVTATAIGKSGPNMDALLVTTLETAVPEPHPPVIEPVPDHTQTLYEAEEAKVFGARIVKDMVDYIHRDGDYIEWTVIAPSAGSYQLGFKYALHHGSRPLEIKVNHAIQDSGLEFTGTGNWKNYEILNMQTDLKKGTNIIRATATSKSGPNMDALIVNLLSKSEAQNETASNDIKRYEAIHAIVHGARVKKNIVDYIHPDNDYIEWAIQVDQEGFYQLDFKYSLSYGERPLQIQIDQNIAEPALNFHSTGSWNTTGSTSLKVSLSKGIHRIRATAIGKSGPNVSALEVLKK